MKRYMMTTRKRYIEEDYSEMVECPEGGWVKWADVKKLEELNKKMVEVLQELVNIVDDSMTGEYKIDSFTTQPARRVLAKAEEVQGE